MERYEPGSVAAGHRRLRALDPPAWVRKKPLSIWRRTRWARPTTEMTSPPSFLEKRLRSWQRRVRALWHTSGSWCALWPKYLWFPALSGCRWEPGPFSLRGILCTSAEISGPEVGVVAPFSLTGLEFLSLSIHRSLRNRFPFPCRRFRKFRRYRELNKNAVQSWVGPDHLLLRWRQIYQRELPLGTMGCQILRAKRWFLIDFLNLPEQFFSFH